MHVCISSDTLPQAECKIRSAFKQSITDLNTIFCLLHGLPLPSLSKRALLFTQSCWKKREILAFHKISTKWNADSLTLDLNLGCQLAWYDDDDILMRNMSMYII